MNTSVEISKSNNTTRVILPDGLRKCYCCKETKSADEFYKNKTKHNGISNICKLCDKKRRKKYYADNIDEIKKREKEYYSKNSDKIIGRGKKYRENNKEEIKKRKKLYCLKNKEHISKKSKEYRANNVQKAKDYLKDYNTHNRDKINNNRNDKYHNDIQFKIAIRLRSRLNQAMNGDIKIGSSIKDLGCTIPELKAYLESKFMEGMNWGNHTRFGWHIDHIYPLSKLDLTDPEQFKKAVHYTNLQPLWWKDNIVKFNKVA